MMRVRTDTRYRECYNTVGDASLTYNISHHSDQEAESVSFRIDKGGVAIGNGSVSRNGRLILSVSEEGGLSMSELRAVCDTLLDDAGSVFNPSTGQEGSE